MYQAMTRQECEIGKYAALVSKMKNDYCDLGWLVAIYEGSKHITDFKIKDEYRTTPYEHLSDMQLIALKAIEICDPYWQQYS